MGLVDMWKKQFEEELLDLRLRVAKLEKNSHPARKFVICDDCKCKIKEK
jgi:hypothetical protein